MTEPGGAAIEPPPFDGAGGGGCIGGVVAGLFGAIVGKAGRVVTDTLGDGASATNPLAAAGTALRRLAARTATKATSAIEPRIRVISQSPVSVELRLDRDIARANVMVARMESLALAASAR